VYSIKRVMEYDHLNVGLLGPAAQTTHGRWGTDTKSKTSKTAICTPYSVADRVFPKQLDFSPSISMQYLHINMENNYSRDRALPIPLSGSISMLKGTKKFFWPILKSMQCSDQHKKVQWPT